MEFIQIFNATRKTDNFDSSFDSIKRQKVKKNQFIMISPIKALHQTTIACKCSIDPGEPKCQHFCSMVHLVCTLSTLLQINCVKSQTTVESRP